MKNKMVKLTENKKKEIRKKPNKFLWNLSIRYRTYCITETILNKKYKLPSLYLQTLKLALSTEKDDD
ncbi:unnamed protein product [marine sediment metagenome]|uniref:Uncharacterized protein n=1 Tax=marine sediment metagenome TaxID=412755 RepID=X0V9V6_9ZZZZ